MEKYAAVLIGTFISLPMASANEAGFRDIVPGGDWSVVEANCEKANILTPYRCYGVTDISFNIEELRRKDMDSCSVSYRFHDFRTMILTNTYQLVAHCGYITCPQVDDFPGRKFDAYLDNESWRWICERGKFGCAQNTCAPFRGFRLDERELCRRIEIETKEVTCEEYSVIGNVTADLGSFDVDLYSSLKSNMSRGYELDWEFTERQVNQFDAGDISNLYVSFQNGQAFIRIYRGVLGGIWLSVEYFTAGKGAALSRSRKPVEAGLSDF